MAGISFTLWLEKNVHIIVPLKIAALIPVKTWIKALIFFHDLTKELSKLTITLEIRRMLILWPLGKKQQK